MSKKVRKARNDTMTDKAEEHQRLIADQFTKQAMRFSQMPDHSPRLILATAEVRPTDTLLDVDCGLGALTLAFAQVARHVTGIDLTPAMVHTAVIDLSLTQRETTSILRMESSCSLAKKWLFL
jgi:2-polyprenyl-3-methyl-5-hydroxy-6-metoxy-1,4-benzoquinol methylase